MDAVGKPKKPAEASEETTPTPGASAQSHCQEIDHRQDGARAPNLPAPDIHPLPETKAQENSDDQGYQMGPMDPTDELLFQLLDLHPPDSIFSVEHFLFIAQGAPSYSISRSSPPSP